MLENVVIILNLISFSMKQRTAIRCRHHVVNKMAARHQKRRRPIRRLIPGLVRKLGPRPRQPVPRHHRHNGQYDDVTLSIRWQRTNANCLTNCRTNSQNYDDFLPLGILVPCPRQGFFRWNNSFWFEHFMFQNVDVSRSRLLVRHPPGGRIKVWVKGGAKNIRSVGAWSFNQRSRTSFVETPPGLGV